jgi:predicted PurR-regulated permease PerM
MKHSKVVELVFFYASILVVAYILWLLFSPYFVALALAGMLVLVAYPLHLWISNKVIRNWPTVAALVSTVITYLFIVAPLCFVLYLLTRETVMFYEQLQANNTFTLDGVVVYIQNLINNYFPEVTLSLSDSLRSISAWSAVHLQTIFSSIVTFALSMFISIMATFFFFRDGKRLVAWLSTISPLPTDQDSLIANRIHIAVRSVLTGVILISLLQGLVAGVGFWIFGVPKPVLWGAVAAFGGLLPGIGTTVIMAPAVAFLYFTGNTVAAIGLLIWAILAIIIVDNIISPLLMGRGNALHPLLVLLSILGGISLFGMIGIIIGPVVVSIFLVLLELQKRVVFEEEKISQSKDSVRKKHKK